MTDGESRPSQDFIDWLDGAHNRIQALLARAETGILTNAEAAETMRDVLADLPGPAGAAVKGVMKRIDGGEDVAPDEAYQTILDAVTTSDTNR